MDRLKTNRRFVLWWSRRPTFGAVVLVAAVAIPGYWRLEQMTNEAHRQAVSSQVLTRRLHELDARLHREEMALATAETAHLAREALGRCQERNSSLYRTRALLRQFVHDATSVLGNRRAATMLNRMPADADVTDCDEDGQITPDDYAENGGNISDES